MKSANVKHAFDEIHQPLSVTNIKYSNKALQPPEICWIGRCCRCFMYRHKNIAVVVTLLILYCNCASLHVRTLNICWKWHENRVRFFPEKNNCYISLLLKILRHFGTRRDYVNSLWLLVISAKWTEWTGEISCNAFSFCPSVCTQYLDANISKTVWDSGLVPITH